MEKTYTSGQVEVIGEGARARIERLEDRIRAICAMEKGNQENTIAYAYKRAMVISEGIKSLRALARRLEGMGAHGQARVIREAANDLAGGLNYAVKHDPARDQARNAGAVDTSQAGPGGFVWIGPR